MTDTLDAITTAQAPETFDVLSFISGTAYPTETVTVYTDALSATELVNAYKARIENDTHGDSDTDDKLTAKIAELTEKVKASALTIELRGMPPGMVRDLYDLPEDAEEQAVREAENKLIANTIVSVKNAAGSQDSRVWDSEGVEGLRRFLKEGEFAKLSRGVVNVNFNASVFDEATDAGFLGGSADVE